MVCMNKQSNKAVLVRQYKDLVSSMSLDKANWSCQLPYCCVQELKIPKEISQKKKGPLAL